MITLRPFDLQNIGLHFKWNNDKELNYYDSDYPYRLEDFDSFIRRINIITDESEVSNFIYEIYASEFDKVIGVIDIMGVDRYNRQCSVDCCIGDKNYRNKGYGSNALIQALELCFEEFGMNKVTTSAFDFNKVWIHVVQKAGFSIEGTLRQHVLKGQAYSDKLIFGMLRREFELAHYSKENRKFV